MYAYVLNQEQEKSDTDHIPYTHCALLHMDDSISHPETRLAGNTHEADYPIDLRHLLSPETRILLNGFRLGEVGSHLLRRAHFVAEELFAREFADETLTPRQKAALIIIYQHPGCNQNTVSDQLFMDRNTVAEMVKRLVAHKLIQRVKASNDRRAYQLYLAPEGAKLLNRIMPRDALVEQRVLDRLPPELRLLFLKCLQTLVQPAEQHSQGNPQRGANNNA